ncbi:MAG: YopX family protein [Lachnospiraceae bacterium]|nr:YopX family protein [Lachnospiraceae bacterium]
MSREILFRGKSLETGEWVHGGYIDVPSGSFIDKIVWDGEKNWKLCAVPVDPSTVCQYTGLTDENGRKIFEGDILEGRWDDKRPEDVTRAVVEWILFGWYIHEIGKSMPDEMDESDIDIWTVCGNIWDTPELLEGGADQ